MSHYKKSCAVNTFIGSTFCSESLIPMYHTVSFKLKRYATNFWILSIRQSWPATNGMGTLKIPCEGYLMLILFSIRLFMFFFSEFLLSSTTLKKKENIARLNDIF